MGQGGGRHNLHLPKALWLASWAFAERQDVRPITEAVIEILGQCLDAGQEQYLRRQDISGCARGRLLEHLSLQVQPGTEVTDKRHDEGSRHVVGLELLLDIHERRQYRLEQLQDVPVHRP